MRFRSHPYPPLHLGTDLPLLLIEGVGVDVQRGGDLRSGLECPETVATSAPPEIIRLAAVCRRLWTFKSRGRPCFFKINLNRQVKVLGVMGRSAPWRRKM